MNNGFQPNQQQLFYQAVIDNDIELVSTLCHLVDINTLNIMNQPAIYHTITDRRWKMARLLLQHKAILTHSNWSNQSNQTVPEILHFAIEDHNVEESFIDFLLSSQTPTVIHIEQRDQDGYTPILTSARSGNLRILKHLIGKYNPNVSAKSSDNGYNLFHCAILARNKCTIELLNTIKLLGININEIHAWSGGLNRKVSPLTLAIYNYSSFEIIKHLVELGADIITNDDREYNPNGYQYSDVNVQSHLFKAIRNFDNFKTFNYLIESCPSSSAIPFKAILLQEFNCFNIESIKLIVEQHRMKLDDDPLQIDLFEFAFQGFYRPGTLSKFSKFKAQIQIIEYLLEQNVQNCFQYSFAKYDFIYTSTPLLILSKYPQTSLRLLQLMVQNGANINDVDEYNCGVIHKLCCVEEDTTVEDIIAKIDYCISAGADINLNIHPTTQNTIPTALHIAVTNKKFASTLVPHLIQQHNAGISLADDCGRVALHYVTQPELVPLLSSPSSINYQDNELRTPLLFFVQCPPTPHSFDWYYQTISNLIKSGADINIPNSDGDYIIHILLTHDFDDHLIAVIELLIKQPNIDLNVVDSRKASTPLQLAIQRFMKPSRGLHHDGESYLYETRLKAIQMMKSLLQYNADVTMKVSQGCTLLHYISMNADIGSHCQIDIDDDLVEDCMDTIINGIIDQIVLTILE